MSFKKFVGNAGAKLKDSVSYFKRHWKTPSKGYDVSFREIACFAAGAGGSNFLGVLTYWTTLAATTPMMISYFKLSTGLIFLLGIAGSVVALVRSPLLSMLIDNSNSKNGKFKPFFIWSTLAAGICYILIPFIPEAWNSVTLFTFKIPALDIFQIDASSIRMSLAVLIMFFLLQAGSIFNTLLNQSLAGIEQTISTVSQERANIGSVKGVVSSLPSSIVNIIMPLAAAAFASGSRSGMDDIRIYRIFFPICVGGALLLALFIIRGTKERIIVKKVYKAKVRFREGAAELSKNKYFWIITLFSAIVVVRALANIVLWVCSYAIGGSTGDKVLAVCNTVLNFGFVPGMVIAPILIKRFGKRVTLTVTSALFAGMIALQLIFIKQPYVVLAGIFFQNIFGGFYLVPGMMASDALDYQQWKTGKRLEGFWQNYTAVITTIIGFFVMLLTPIFLAMGGLAFDAEVDTAFQNQDIMYGAFRYQTLFALIGSIVCIIPMFFYNLSEKRHADIIRVLKLRAAVQNHKDGAAEAKDAETIIGIVKYAEENNNVFVLDEIKKHDIIGQLTASFEPVSEK